MCGRILCCRLYLLQAIIDYSVGDILDFSQMGAILFVINLMPRDSLLVSGKEQHFIS